MSVQFCYDIINTNNSDLDIDQLKLFVQGLYTSKKICKDPYTCEEDELPYVTIFSEPDNSVCIMLLSKTKANLEHITKVHSKLKPQNLVFNEFVSLSTPYQWTVENRPWEAMAKKGGVRWKTLTHYGPYFGHLFEPYKHLRGSIKYDNTIYYLTPDEERVARYYASRRMNENDPNTKLTTFYTRDSTFNTNFWNDFQTYLTPEHKQIFKKMENIDWTPLETVIQKEKEKETSEKEKRQKKVIRAEADRKYGYATINGYKEKVGNYAVEPAGLFLGRGLHPLRGKIKPNIIPEDITINTSGPVPKPPSGHKWKSVVNDPTSIWLSKWTDPVIGGVKYIQFAPQGLFKGQNDFLKYEAARKLARFITTVRETYMKDAVNGTPKLKQLATVLFFIDNFGIRVGNEKDQDEAETVGATTLESGHIELKPPDGIKLHFLGKDSILFSKELMIPETIFRNLEVFKQGKANSDQLFNLVDASDINEYLKQFDKSFSAKVFRTRLATSIMLDELSKLKVPKKATKKDVDHIFKKANAKVAEVLNHTRNVPAGASKAIDKLKDKIKANTDKMKNAKTEKAKKKLKEMNTKLRKDIKTKQETKGVAVTTSLTNYIDPRVVTQWMEKYGVPHGHVYSATLLKKFKWALDSTSSEWDYEKEPLFGVSNDLDPTGQEEPPIVEPYVDVADEIESLFGTKPKPTKATKMKPTKATKMKPTKTTKTTKATKTKATKTTKATKPISASPKPSPVKEPTNQQSRERDSKLNLDEKHLETLFKSPSWITDDTYNQYTYELADYCENNKEPSIEAIEALWHLIKRGNTEKARRLMGLYFDMRHIFSN